MKTNQKNTSSVQTAKARRRQLESSSKVYVSLIDLGFELVALAKDGVRHDRIAHMASELAIIAKCSGHSGLYDLFYDIAEDYCVYDEISEDYFGGIKQWLQDLASDAMINPGLSSTDKALLDEFTLPIHARMVDDPEQSPRYFVELADALDKLIKTRDLSAWVAARELSHALDRPQIEQSEALKSAVLAAYKLELPETIRTNDPRNMWDAFYETLRTAR